ncbi:hypothetical protein D3C73_1527580 [compost metagenome]
MSGARLEECRIERSILLRNVSIRGNGEAFISSILGDNVCITGLGGGSATRRFILGDLSQCDGEEG